MPKKESYFLSREALYIRVWETPTVKLAKEFGVSDVAIAKMCKRLEIPKPPLGYWRRIETGYKKTIPPLSEPSEKAQRGVWIYPKSEEQTLEFNEEYQQQNAIVKENIARQAEAEAQPENKITVASTLHKMHPFVAQTQKALSKGQVDMYGAVHGKWGEKYLNLRISKENLGRALRIMDALLKGLDKRGCKINILIDDQLKTEVEVNGIKIEITLQEDFKRFERDSKTQKKKSIYESDRFYYKPTGNLTFSINNSYHTQHNWRDGKTSVLEDQLNNIVAGIFHAAEDLRQRKINRKNEVRHQLELSIEREKNKILQQRQVNCRELFSELLGKWQKSQELIRFISAYEAKILKEKGGIPADGEELMLIEWAKNYAEKLNPIENNRMNEVIDKVKHLLDDPAEKESYDYSNLTWKLKYSEKQ